MDVYSGFSTSLFRQSETLLLFAVLVTLHWVHLSTHTIAEQFVKARLELYPGKMVDSKLPFPYQYHNLLWLLHKDDTLFLDSCR